MSENRSPLTNSTAFADRTTAHQMTGFNVNVNGTVPVGYSIQAVNVLNLLPPQIEISSVIKQIWFLTPRCGVFLQALP